MNEVFLTEEGYKKIKDELNRLYQEKKEIDREVQETKEQGDLSENAGYQYAKERQLSLIRKISELENMLRNSRIVNNLDVKKDEIRIGARVRILDLKTNQEKEYTIVSSVESDPVNGKISINSPLASSLLGLKVGDVKEINLPNGKKEFKILTIEY